MNYTPLYKLLIALNTYLSSKIRIIFLLVFKTVSRDLKNITKNAFQYIVEIGEFVMSCLVELNIPVQIHTGHNFIYITIETS